MATVIRWRAQPARGRPPNTAAACRPCTVNQRQVGLVVAMVVTASCMARAAHHDGQSQRMDDEGAGGTASAGGAPGPGSGPC